MQICPKNDDFEQQGAKKLRKKNRARFVQFVDKKTKPKIYKNE